MIRMANQIAAFFEAYSRSEALDGIATHIRNFWTPRMRTQLTEYIEGGAEGLSARWSRRPLRRRPRRNPDTRLPRL